MLLDDLDLGIADVTEESNVAIALIFGNVVGWI